MPAAPRSPQPSPTLPRRTILLCFALSGAAGLVYQVVWIRQLSLVFGNTAQAVSTVVAAFLAGLALGSYAWGRRAARMRRPLAAYVSLEALIALSAIGVTVGLPALDILLLPAWSVDSLNSIGWQALRFALVLVIVGVPTALMGGTLPVIGRVWVSSLADLGRGIGSLYAANTCGAMLGAFGCGFVLIPWLGLRGSVAVAVFANLLIAAVLWPHRGMAAGSPKPEQGAHEPEQGAHEPEQGAHEPVPGADEPAPEAGRGGEPSRALLTVRRALLLAGLAGFCALAYEMLWARAFAIATKSTVYVFSNLLTVYLAGTALGSHLLSRRLDRITNPARLLGVAQAAIGALGVTTICFAAWTGPWHQALAGLGEMTWRRDVLLTFALMIGAIGLPAVLLGFTFPLLCRATTRAVGDVARDMGSLYAAGTVGGIAGSLVAGFVLLPTLGLQLSLVLVSLLSAACAQLALAGLSADRARWAPAAAAAVVVLAGLVLPSQGINIGYGPRAAGETVFAREDVVGTVRVVREAEGEGLGLFVNNHQLAHSGDISVRFGHLPLVLRPEARDVLLISLGSGITAGSVAQHPVDRIDCVEIVPSLRDVQPYFAADNHDVLSDPRMHLWIWDGRHFVRATDRSYDLIIADLFQPDSAGVGSLYALEHFEAARDRLKPGGAMAQWLPLYQLAPDDLAVVMRTFAEAFDHVTVWMGDIVSERPSLLLLGSPAPQVVDPNAVAKALARPGALTDLFEHGDPFSLLSAFVTDRAGVLAFTEGAPLNTDDRPVIEYGAPQHVWARAENAVRNFERLAALREDVTPLLGQAAKDPRAAAVLGRYRDARTRILRGKVLHARHEYGEEWRLLQEAATFAPHDPVLAWAAVDMGYLLVSNGRCDDAIATLEWANAVSPTIFQSYELLERCHTELGDPEAAAAAKKRAQALLNPR